MVNNIASYIFIPNPKIFMESFVDFHELSQHVCQDCVILLLPHPTQHAILSHVRLSL